MDRPYLDAVSGDLLKRQWLQLSPEARTVRFAGPHKRYMSPSAWELALKRGTFSRRYGSDYLDSIAGDLIKRDASAGERPAHLPVGGLVRRSEEVIRQGDFVTARTVDFPVLVPHMSDKLLRETGGNGTKDKRFIDSIAGHLLVKRGTPANSQSTRAAPAGKN